MSDAVSPPPDQVIFGIPLVSKAVANDWPSVNRLLAATLGSLLGQSSRRFHIVIAGTDRPDIDLPAGVRFVGCADFGGPTIAAQHKDTEHKRGAIAAAARELGGEYLMFVDADDLVSSRLVEHVLSDQHPSGYVLDDGYVFNIETGVIAHYPFPDSVHAFDAICGTSAIVRFAAGDLPDGTGFPSLYQSLFRQGHAFVRRSCFEDDRPLAKMPFPAVAYVRATPNHSSDASDNRTDALTFYSRLMQELPKYAIERTPALDGEFNLRAAEDALKGPAAAVR